jgi:ribosomal protein S7
MRTGTVKFSMNQKVTDSLQTKKQEKTFCSCFRNQRGRIAKVTELAMKKKKEEKKVAESSSYLSKKFIFLPTNV